MLLSANDKKKMINLFYSSRILTYNGVSDTLG